MKPPAFQFYADDFLAGVLTLTLAERGLYITALCLQWNKGYITPTDFDRLGSGMDEPSMSHVKAKFEIGADGHLRNARMEAERKKQADYREERSKSGHLGAAARWHSDRSAMAQPMAKNGSPSPSPVSITKERESGQPENGSRIQFTEFTVPSWPEVKAWAEMDGVPETVAREFFDHENSFGQWRAGGRVNGMPINGRNALKVWFNRSRKVVEKQSPNGPSAGTAEMILRTKELDRVEKRIAEIRNGRDSHVDMSAKERDELKTLKTRRVELMNFLSLKV